MKSTKGLPKRERVRYSKFNDCETWEVLPFKHSVSGIYLVKSGDDDCVIDLPPCRRLTGEEAESFCKTVALVIKSARELNTGMKPKDLMELSKQGW